MKTLKYISSLFITLTFVFFLVIPINAQTSLGKMTAFWRTCMMTGGADQITPWHLYQNPVSYLDSLSDFPYNYSKYGLTSSSSFVLHGDVATYVRFLSTGSNNTYDLAKRVNGQVQLQTAALAQRFAATEASGVIKNYIIVFDNIPFCFPDSEDIRIETYGQTALPASMTEWSTFIVDLCNGIENILGTEKANNLSFRMGTEAHDGSRYFYTDPNVMLNFYKFTAQAVKSVLPDARFGPYNTCVPWDASRQVLEFPDLVTYCMANNLPLDFIGYSWYVQGSNPLINPTGFIDHFEEAESINPALNNVPKVFHEFGCLGMSGNLYMRPSCDNAAAMFNMLVDARAGGFSGNFHWPLDVKIVDTPTTYVLNGPGWMFQVLDHTTGGDACLLNTVVTSVPYGTTVRTLGAFNCDNGKNYLIVSSFNPDINKSGTEIVKVVIPKSYINLETDSFHAATLDRTNCPLLAIRNDIQSAGYLSADYVSRPNITPYFPVHYVLVSASVTNMTQAKNVIYNNRNKYVELCENSLTLQDKPITVTETATTYELYIPTKANSISAIVLEAEQYADVTKTVGGAGANFPTLKAAFDSINADTGSEYSGTVDLQIINDVTETEAILTTANPNWTSVRIYPTVTRKTITYMGTTQPIELQGADNVTIDGRLYNYMGVCIDSTADLTVSSATGVIAFTGDASNNTLTYCNLKGKKHASAGQLIRFGSALTTGNNNNTVSYNNITTPSGTIYSDRPFTIVRFDAATGSVGSDNNIISHNNIYDCFRADAITIVADNDNNTISDNSFSETTSDVYVPITNSTVIRENGSSGTVISGNYIGGSGPGCKGTWANNTPGSTSSGYHLFAINIQNSASNVTVENNTIRNFDWHPNNIANLWRGISVDQTASNVSVTGNVIGDISVTNSGAGTVYAIYYNSTASGNVISGNFIYNLSYMNAGGNVYGMKIDKGPATFSNNIISLGSDFQNTVYGIYNKGDNAAYTCNLYFNTVYIGGVPTGGSYESYGLYSYANTNTRNYRNNVIVNGRSNSGATGKHYAVYLNYGTNTGLTLNYNDYYVSGTGGTFGYYNSTDRANLSVWQSVTSKDANSLEINPLLYNAGDTLSIGYMTNSAINLPGDGTTGVTSDFAGDARAATPRMGAYELTYTGQGFVKSTLTQSPQVEPSYLRVICNATGIIVPLQRDSNIELYSICGILIDKVKTSSVYTRNLDHGIYIIRINEEVIKFAK